MEEAAAVCAGHAPLPRSPSSPLALPLPGRRLSGGHISAPSGTQACMWLGDGLAFVCRLGSTQQEE